MTCRCPTRFYSPWTGYSGIWCCCPRLAADVLPPPPPHTHTSPLPHRLDVAAPVDVETPAHLMSEEEVEALVRERQPAFVPLAGPGTEGEGRGCGGGDLGG